MRNREYHLYLTDTEYSRIIAALINLKNDLIAQGRYTDGVDDVLCKVTSAKKQKMKIFYIYCAEMCVLSLRHNFAPSCSYYPT